MTELVIEYDTFMDVDGWFIDPRYRRNDPFTSWCMENLGYYPKAEMRSTAPPTESYSTGVVGHFLSDDHAAMFKLKWL
jgi:hypothetical protein